MSTQDDRTAADASLGATAALAALSLAVAAGMGRLFAGGEHLIPLATAALAAHAVMWAGRRFGLSIPLSAVAALAAVGLASAWLLFPDTTTAGIPGSGTLTAARSALADAWTQFSDVVAPAPPTDGFLLASMIGIGATAVLADWAAFRMGVLFEAVVPSFTLFVFTATLGDEAGRRLMVATYLGTLLLFLVVHRAGLEAEGTSWFASRSRGGSKALVRGASGLIAVAILAALVVGPQLPGASADAVLAWRDTGGEDGSGRRTTVSPLVSIKGRLVDQSNIEVFSVASTRRAYWRLTSLDTFNGVIWSSDASYQQIGERIPRSATPPAADTVEQQFTIRSLSSIWLPAAYRPVRVEGIEDVSYNDDLGSLITGETTTDGYTYSVVSAQPTLERADLEGQGTPILDNVERFTAVPPVSPRVAQLAAQITSGAGSPFEQARALQDYFRAGTFRYDLSVNQGHDEQALENFLFTTRAGYCEQFAGAYAVLARLTGLPTRVAVGFTPGELGADGLFHVRGLNAHAWPEVYMGSAGWVAFEPTPGRGAPGAESYTGVPEQQAAPGSNQPPTTAPATTTTAPDDTATPSTTRPPTQAATEADEARPVWRNPFVFVILLVVSLLVLLAIGVPVVKAARKRRRRTGATTAADKVWVAWTEAADAVGRAGVPRKPSETLGEHARRAAAGTALPPPAVGALEDLAYDAAAASYSSGDLDDEDAARAGSHVVTIEEAVKGLATRRQRVAWVLDPRPLLPRRPGPPPPEVPLLKPPPRRRRRLGGGQR